MNYNLKRGFQSLRAEGEVPHVLRDLGSSEKSTVDVDCGCATQLMEAIKERKLLVIRVITRLKSEKTDTCTQSQ